MNCVAIELVPSWSLREGRERRIISLPILNSFKKVIEVQTLDSLSLFFLNYDFLIGE